MSAVEIEPVVDDLAEHEWDIPCEKSNHKGRSTAAWVVLLTGVPCGCHDGVVSFWCEPCRQRRMKSDGVRCRVCKRRVFDNPMGNIVRIEAIR